MSKPRIWRRRTSAALLASVMVAGAVTLVGGASTASANPSTEADVLKDTPTDTLGSHDLDLLAEAEAKSEQTVTLIVATDKGQAPKVAAGLKELGGTIGNQVDEVGYVRARVPTSNVIKASKIPGVSAIDLNEEIALPDPTPESRAAASSVSTEAAGPGPDTPAVNPYMPTNETGAVSFKKSHPRWDGRNVVVGIMDSGIDLDHPALQTTTTGERKIVDWVTPIDPVFENDGTWRPMLTDATGPSFSYAGVTWTAPAGTYKINLFAENITVGGAANGDVNRDGDTTDRFGVLYDPATGDVRVDTDQDFDFTDEPLMRPYNESFDIGHFGTDDPATPIAEQVPFVVEYRTDVDTTPVGGPGLVDYVNIGMISSSHGTHVAGIVAANDMLGNEDFDGAAPGAKLVSSRACTFAGGCTAAALTDGMIDLVLVRGVDIINMSIGGLPALNDGNNARAQLYDILIDEYGVQMFISAGNSGPGANTIGDPSVAASVVSVGASISRDTWAANYGSEVRTRNAMFNFSSRGPREDGGFKPNISAPGSAISTVAGWEAGSPVPEAGYPLPPGYAMYNGTSMAAPQATGAVALLLSGAAANDLEVTPQQLRRALYTGARWINGVPAYAQGNGMLHVADTWKLLREGVEAPSYTVDAPVCTPISEFLATPNRGTGVYNRCAADAGGHRPGQFKSYPVTITRTTGPDSDVLHKLKWVGNDGTFAAPGQVVLPLNEPVTITVRATPESGIRSAILRVDNPFTSTVDFEIMNAVVASNPLPGPEFGFSTSGKVDRNGFTSYFVTVPEGASALQVNLSGLADGSQTRFIAINPWGVPVESTSSLVCFSNFSDPAGCKPDERDYQNPMPGVWEIEVESRRTSPLLQNPFTLTARVQGVTVDPATTVLENVTAGEPSPLSWTVTNTFGPVNVSGQGGSLGSASSERPTIADLEVQTFQVTVPAGATRLYVAIGNTSDLGADLDLFVYRGGSLIAYNADGDSEETVTINNPPAGVYDIEVDGYAVPAGTTEYDYLDVFYSTGLGTIAVEAGEVELANGASATLTGSVTVDSVPAAGRELFGEMLVVTEEGAVVGRGAVSVESVS
ncbi:S8 family serine peptidase [Solwaraspora sp. WMMD406]|uniref:S8 family serine peptidase n=1 Tax=Solwaraspora sp. WMMD406 TaxID=3016095 RepID=UPI0024171910|nr:S8 family serine peptidase [Solwaraspora sp. WMMD406]MDG4767815.1 S8 family serine peptidase [Solwaraspora sp. WMMD406]